VVRWYTGTVHSLTEKIKLRAREIGFDKVGVARAEPLDDEGARLFQWLDNGYHGEMAWMERWREKRVDPSELLPNAKSVIAVVLNYFTPHKHTQDAASGKISRYAWGDDYHDILKEKLYELLGFITSELPAATGKVCVDTAPIMDKVWAERAGLGWIGKNSNLITTDVGSWVFLGEIILDAELEYAPVTVADHCGSCTACIDACPTSAIVEPYVVDARRCISYATIELRDETLPAEFDGKLDGWVYGCDICQDVCPWNRFEKPTDDVRFEPRLGQTSLELAAVEELNADSFARRFRRSAMKRTKLAGLRRNAAALKNTG
jgi:epoxyqueuosine reductase